MSVDSVRQVSAHELGLSRDCATPNCPNEAEPGQEHCRQHREHEPTPRHVPVEFEPEPVVQLPARPCRTKDCENQANRRYSRGAFSGLCEEKCIPAKREEMSRAAMEQHGKDLCTVENESEVIVLMVKYYREYGRLPRSTDWMRRTKDYPSYDQVVNRVEWPKALAAAQKVLDGEDPDALARGIILFEDIDEHDHENGASPPSLAALAAELEEAKTALGAATERYEAAVTAFEQHPLVDEIARRQL